MSEHTEHLQAAYIIHSRNYKETSLILDVFTKEFGRVSTIAKGVRKAKSKTAGLLQPFIPLQVSYTGKTDLKTLTHVEIIPPARQLSGIAMYCGFYLNDLVMHFLHQYDPHPEVFKNYRECLMNLDPKHSLERPLRLFELNLLEHVGFGLQLDHEGDSNKAIDSNKRYVFFPDRGAVATEAGPISGKTLIALREKKLNDREILFEAKWLLRRVIDFHLPGQTLNSRLLIAKHRQLIIR